ncbi:hypothetical protein L3Q82_018087 [Scortum barcoo]|uniref:Uncharacterized protein n=1 Tax=Scortum barcoo TaxID=214431 RepID=A0ACB8VIH9_9TELE|nr:hypothetical protein L3Q82_018087 [Scortum barcoo]
MHKHHNKQQTPVHGRYTRWAEHGGATRPCIVSPAHVDQIKTRYRLFSRLTRKLSLLSILTSCSAAMAESKSKCYCSVPLCKTNKQRQPYLSFHGFPSDTAERKKWVRAVRRVEGPDFNVLRGSTFVCSLHFRETDYTPAVRCKRLKIGAVPSRFQWNNWGESRQAGNTRPGLSLTGGRCEDLHTGARGDHVYALPPALGTLDTPSVRIQMLKAEVQKLETELTQLKVSHLDFHKFCVSDDDMHFYTRFPSEEAFLAFWEAVQPSASMLVYWSKAQEKGQIFSPTSPRPLQLIDEFFLYCCRVAAGLKEKVLADIFQVSVSMVYCVVITWANYLYLLLGSLPIWMSRQQVKSTMPLAFRQYSPDVRVIVDFMEVRCQSQSPLTLQSEVSSSYGNAKTFKGLIGIAPCGAVIFVSSLYVGLISDQELTEQCGILDLLEPGDGCMADKGFSLDNMLTDRGAILITPPFKSTAQFNHDNAPRAQAAAGLQILVERAIRRVKEYHIWDSILPPTLFGTVNQLWTSCCLMTNFQGPLDLKDHIHIA